MEIISNGVKLNKLTIRQAHHGLKKKEFSVKELTKNCLNEIKKKDSKINSYIAVFEKKAINKAEDIDQLIKIKNVENFLVRRTLEIKDNILIK